MAELSKEEIGQIKASYRKWCVSEAEKLSSGKKYPPLPDDIDEIISEYSDIDFEE